MEILASGPLAVPQPQILTRDEAMALARAQKLSHFETQVLDVAWWYHGRKMYVGTKEVSMKLNARVGEVNAARAKLDGLHLWPAKPDPVPRKTRAIQHQAVKVPASAPVPAPVPAPVEGEPRAEYPEQLEHSLTPTAESLAADSIRRYDLCWKGLRKILRDFRARGLEALMPPRPPEPVQ